MRRYFQGKSGSALIFAAICVAGLATFGILTVENEARWQQKSSG